MTRNLGLQSSSWNCQDYILEIWQKLKDQGMVSEEIWKSGKQKSMKFYGHVAAAAGRFDRCVTTE
jgi:hypothetical protein